MPKNIEKCLACRQAGFAPILIIILIAIIGASVIFIIRNIPINQSQPTTTSATQSSSSSGIESSSSPTISKTISKKPTPTVKPTVIPSATSSLIPTESVSDKVPSCQLSPSNGMSTAPMTINFSAVDKINGAKYHWDFDGDGNWDTDMSSDNSSLSHTYIKSGQYTPKMQAQSSKGETSSICSGSITVFSPTTCEVHLDKSSGISPLTVNFFYGATYGGGTDNYVTKVQWDFDGDGNWDTSFDISPDLEKPSHTYTQKGTYTAKMHLQTKDGYTSDICTKTISVE